MSSNRDSILIAFEVYKAVKQVAFVCHQRLSQIWHSLELKALEEYLNVSSVLLEYWSVLIRSAGHRISMSSLKDPARAIREYLGL